MPTTILNKEHFTEAIKFAKTLPPKSVKSLKDAFHRLNAIKRHNDLTLTLQPDWVAHSWVFGLRTQGGKPFMFGGIILHGFQETFSVELSSAAYPHWSIHT